MFRDFGNWTKTADELLDTTRWQSHSQMISWEDARELELVVEYLDYQSNDWKKYWDLFCHQRLSVGDRQKLYESSTVSLVVGPSE